MKFRTTRKGIRASLEPMESAVLAQCAADLLELLGGPDDQDPLAAPGIRDPLAELVGMPSGEVTPPQDPALARLLPDAYRPPASAESADSANSAADPRDGLEQASADFRRYTDADLRAGKRAAASTVLISLHSAGGTMVLDREQADAWLGFLNDVRLTLGTRLGVTEDTDPDDGDDDDPRTQALQIYSWLGWVQESLLHALSSRRR